MNYNLLQFIKYELLDMKGILEKRILEIPITERNPVRIRIEKLNGVIGFLNFSISLN